MWTYERATGMLHHGETLLVTGYSGHGEGLNNPSLSNVPDVGPIPAGLWSIGDSYTDPEKGPVVMALSPIGSTLTFGRSGFLIHGDNSKLNQSASLGCIILPRFAREVIAESTDRALEVL